MNEQLASESGGTSQKERTAQRERESGKRWIDLHTHSVCSDGSMTPGELVRHAKEQGLAAIALSDHDTADGVKDAMDEGKRLGVEVIPAIELSCQSAAETHILGYFIDPDSLPLRRKLTEIRRVREARVAENCAKLQRLGIAVSLEEVRKKARGGILCRAHIAKIMAEKGVVATPKEAFARYLDPGRPAHAQTQAISDEEAIALIREAGGDAYLAHLHLTGLTGDALDAFVRRLSEAGLTGLEGYYTDYTPSMTEEIRTLAEKYRLKLSGGTDFHGAFKPHIQLGRGLGNLAIPYAVLAEMKRRSGAGCKIEGERL